MNRQALWAIALLLGALAIAGTMIALRSEPEEQDIIASAPLVTAQAYSVSSGALEIQGTGTVGPREEVSLGAEVAGRLVWVNPNFREGGSIGRGETLFRIDVSEYQNRVRSAQADVAAQDVAVLQAREEVSIAQAELQRFANRESARGASNGIGGAQILPPEGLEAAASAPTATAEPNILATREPQLRSARAARERAAAQLADAQLSLSRTAVRSPFAGLVRSETASVGTLVQPGTTLGSVVATGAFEVRVSLSESQAALIPGLFNARGANIPASVEMEYGGRMWRWPAVVDRADAILDPATRTIDVFLRVNNPLRAGVAADGGEGSAPPLLLGSFVRASITAGASAPYASIPLEALRDGNNVWLLAQGKLRIVEVDVIQRLDEIALVSGEGLGAGGHIITSALRTPVEAMDLRSETVSATQAEITPQTTSGDEASE